MPKTVAGKWLLHDAFLFTRIIKHAVENFATWKANFVLLQS